ncbi:MAG TPA: hypothetical protein VF145_00630 [Chitinophagaceae bacterium]
MGSELNKRNDPDKAMDRESKVKSADKRLKQDFPGYPHNPASNEAMKDERNWRTDFSNPENTTATGTESVRGKRPTAGQNSLDSSTSDGSTEELKEGSDRGLNMHDREIDHGERD